MVRVQREKIQSGRNEDKTRFEGEDGVRVMQYQKGARLSSGGIAAGGVQEGRHSAGRCEISTKSREGRSRSESCQEF